MNFSVFPFQKQHVAYIKHIFYIEHLDKPTKTNLHQFNTLFLKKETIKMFDYEPDLLTRKQAQNLLSVGKNTILNLIQNGYLPAFVIGNSYRIYKEDLIEFIEKTAIRY